MIADIQRLTDLVPPPSVAPPRPDWSRVSAALGTEVPPDYVELIDLYGGGQFDGYLWLLEPFSANESYDLVRSYEERTEALHMLWDDDEPKPDFASPDGVRLIPWASTDNGEFIYWRAVLGVPARDWTVVVNEARGEEWETFDVGCARFLVDTMAGAVESELLWSDYPTDPHTFAPMSSF